MGGQMGGQMGGHEPVFFTPIKGGIFPLMEH